MCDKSKYPLSENDIHENRIAWLLRRTAIRINHCGADTQRDHDKCFMCDKDIAETKVECANCYLTYCEDCFGEGMDGCEECNDIMYADSDDEESDDDEEEDTSCNYTANCVWCDKCKCCRWCDNCDCEENKIGYDCCICDESDDENLKVLEEGLTAKCRGCENKPDLKYINGEKSEDWGEKNKYSDYKYYWNCCEKCFKEDDE